MDYIVILDMLIDVQFIRLRLINNTWENFFLKFYLNFEITKINIKDTNINRLP